AALTYRQFGLAGRTRKDDLTHVSLPSSDAIVAAFAINEIADARARDDLLAKLVGPAARRSALIVEPIAGFVAPGWDTWRGAVVSAGGRADEWRFRVELPAILAKLDHAAGLDHRELTARSLWLRR